VCAVEVRLASKKKKRAGVELRGRRSCLQENIRGGCQSARRLAPQPFSPPPPTSMKSAVMAVACAAGAQAFVAPRCVSAVFVLDRGSLVKSHDKKI